MFKLVEFGISFSVKSLTQIGKSSALHKASRGQITESRKPRVFKIHHTVRAIIIRNGSNTVVKDKSHDIRFDKKVTFLIAKGN